MINTLGSTKILTKRNISFDIMRLIAIIMVLYNHRILYSFFLISNNSFERVILSIFAVFSRCGPPIFFMISGALLIGKDEKISDILKHRVFRIIVIMLIISIYAFFRWNSGLNYIQIFFTKLNWYLYAYVAYLLMLPLLRRMVTNLTVMHMKYLLVCSIIFYSLGGILPVLGFGENFLTNLTLFNSMWGSNCWHILCPSLGYIWIKIVNDKNKNKYVTVLALGCALTLIITCLLLKYDGLYNNSVNVEQILQHAVLLPSSFVFVFIFNYFKDKNFNTKLTKTFSTLSATIFGVFLLETHTSISTIIYNYINKFLNNMYLSTFVGISFSLIALSFAIFLLRLIPGVKKIL